MNYARNYEYLLNVVKVMPKILVVQFFSDTVYSKIHHITLIMCTPFFVNSNNNIFAAKTLLFVVHLGSQQRNRKINA